MGLPKLKTGYTVEQYLAIERAQDDRLGYLDGEIYAMAGESGEHGDISMNLSGLLHGQLKGSSCRARSKDTKVRSGPVLAAGDTKRCLFSYPDIVVICYSPEYLDERKDVVLNPSVIIEVLSDSTEAFDRGEKFSRFQSWNPSLSDYLLVSQDQPRIEHYTKQPDGSWTYRRALGLEAVVEIPNIRCTLKLAEVYDRVAFPKQ